MTPLDKSLIRVEDQQRIDTPEFQHLQRQVMYWHESIGALLSSQSFVRGFELSVVDPTTLRVTPDTASDNGVIIVPELGAGNNEAPHDAQTSYSVVVDINPTAKDRSLSTFATGQYLHVYASAVWNEVDLNQRVFWVPPTGPEAVNSINTRFVLEWQLQVLPHHQPVPARSVRIGTVYWSGALTAPDLYQAAQMLFEGEAVDGGSSVEVPSGGAPSFGGFWQDAGEGTIPDFSRSDDRWTNGAKSFAQFSRMVLREVQEIKSQSEVLTPKHWEKPPYGLSLRAAQPVTFTIGEGTKLSEGNLNGTPDPLNPGYYNIGVALSTLSAAAVAEGMEDVCIRLKPGRYSLTTLVTIPGTIRLEIHGCGPLAVCLKFTNNGKIKIETNAATEASAGLTVASMSIEGTTADNLIEVQSSNIGTETSYHFQNIGVTQTAGAAWLRQTQEGRGVKLHLHNVRTDDDSIIRFLNLSDVLASHCALGHVYIENVTGTAERQVRVTATHLTSFRCDDNIGDVIFNGCTAHHINIVNSDLLTIVGTSFVVNGALEDALGTVDSSLTVTTTLGVSLQSSVFRSNDSSATNVAYFDGCGRVAIANCGFSAPVGALSVPDYGVRAVNMTPAATQGLRASMTSCWLVGPGETWVDGFTIRDCRFTSESAVFAQGTMIANAEEIHQTTVEVAQGTPTKLFDGVGHIDHCEIDVGAIGAGIGEIVPTDDFVLIDSSVNLQSGGMTISAANILFRDVLISGSAPNNILLISTQNESRIALESLKTELDVRLQSASGIRITMAMNDCEAKSLNATARMEHVRLDSSIFAEGALVYCLGPGKKSSVEVKGCAFYAKRFWSPGTVAKLTDTSDALADFGLQIWDDEAVGTGIDRILIEGCEFWQSMDASSFNSAILVRATDGEEITIRNNYIGMVWPAMSWTAFQGPVSLTYAKRVQVEDNIFWSTGDPTARPGPMVDVRDQVAQPTVVTRWSFGFDENQVQFEDPTTAMKFDTTYGRIVYLDDVGTVVKAQASFCRNKVDARWSNPSPRVFWTDNAGIISAGIALGVCYENTIADGGTVISSFNATSPGGNISTIFAGAYGDNFFG